MRQHTELGLSNLGQLELLRGVAERGAALRTTVLGFSMTPFVCDGDAVTIAPFGGADPRRGDIVAVALPANGRLVLHRVVARAGEGWLLRGDNCPQADGVVHRPDLLGRVVRVERGGREIRLGVRPGLGGALVARLSHSGALVRGRALRRSVRRRCGERRVRRAERA